MLASVHACVYMPVRGWGCVHAMHIQPSSIFTLFESGSLVH